MQPDGTPSGRYAFVTGASAGSSANTYDLDGQTTIRSVPIALPATPGALSFSYVFAHGPSSAADFFRLYVEDEGGTKHLVWHVDGTASTVGACVAPGPGQPRRLRRAEDPPDVPGERRRARQPGRGRSSTTSGSSGLRGRAARRIAPTSPGRVPGTASGTRASGAATRRPDRGRPARRAMRCGEPTTGLGRTSRASASRAVLRPAIFLTVTPTLACGGLIGPNGAVNLLRTTTFAGYHDGVEHYVTAFQFAGGGGAFGSITPLPGVPTSVVKGGDWTLQRLIRETNPVARKPSPAGSERRSPAGAVELMNVKIDALDITVLKGGAADIGDVGDGPRLPAPARRAGGPRLLRQAQPDLPRRRVRRRRGEGPRPAGRRRDARSTSRSRPPTRGSRSGSSPSARPAAEPVQADVYLLTDRAPALLPVPTGDERDPPRPRATTASDEPPHGPPLRPRAWTGSRRPAG